MTAALKQLLDDLDDVVQSHDEVEDTDVREQMAHVVRSAFITPQAGFRLPDEFGMFSPEGNQLVKAALSRFLSNGEVAAAANTLGSPQERLDAFQDNSVLSKAGHAYDDYFGYAESP